MTDEPTDVPPEEPVDEEPVDDTAAESGRSGASGPPARHVDWGRPTRITVASLALIAMMFLFVFPTRSYFAQQQQVGHAQHAVAVLKAQNEQLTREAKRLKTPSEIERLAREQFNMVLPGEQAYNVVQAPADSSPTTTTTAP